MILKGAQRGGAKQLALHLLKTTENEHVELYEVRGFVSGDLAGALHEAYAISRGTRCRQFLFSLSLNPPPQERVTVETFEQAIDEAEKRLGLEGQPRVVIFHEKEGRRHAHCVWSRIDAEKMTAINLPFYKSRLQDLSKDIFLEQRWQMPRGLVDNREKNPLNFTRAEWQQSIRAGKDPKALKALFQECWAASPDRAAFREMMQERGYWLAQGDRRGVVAVDIKGEVYAVSRWTGLKTKEVRGKLGDGKDLPGVEQTKAKIAAEMTPVLTRYMRDIEEGYQKRAQRHRLERTRMAEQHRSERQKLDEGQEKRWTSETAARAARMSRGFRGLWDRITGRYEGIKRQNEREAFQAWQRDRAQREALIAAQLDERKRLQERVLQVRKAHEQERAELEADIAAFLSGRSSAPELERTRGPIPEQARQERRRGRGSPEPGLGL